MKILILCTGNSCRSQMAEAILKQIDSSINVFSAGTRPEKMINPNTVAVMKEIGIDISNNKPKNVTIFANENFDYVITVCDNAKETCPVFRGNVKHFVHIPFEDPALFSGSQKFIISQYRRIRDEIKRELENFYKTIN